MPATFISPKAKFIVPSLIVLSLFLSACSATGTTSSASPSPAAQVSQVPVDVASPTPAATINTVPTDPDATVYDKTVHYNNPGGGDDVRFVLFVGKDGVIEDAQAEVKAVHQTSIMMQTNFASNVKTAVVGKKLADLKVDRIGGASLTTGAFNEFLKTIET